MKGARGGDHPQLTCQGKNNNCRHVEGEVGNGLLERRAGVGEVNHVGSLQDCLKGLWKSTCASALQFGRSACDFISTITKKKRFGEEEAAIVRRKCCTPYDSSI